MNKQRDPHELARSLSDKIDELQTDVEDALLFTIGGESDEYRRAMRHISCEFLRNLHHRVLDKIVQGTYPNPSNKEKKMKEELQDTFQEWVKTDSEKAYISLEIGSDGHVLHLPISYATLDADGDLVINAYGLTPDHIKTHLVER